MGYTLVDNFLDSINCDYIKNESMKKHTSFKIGGSADRFVKVKTESELSSLVQFLNKNNVPYYIWGKGSNILVTDKGIRAVVISLEGDFTRIELTSDTEITCGTGVSLSALSVFAKNHRLTGLEFAHGIPGLLGGAVYMNAGAYGGEMKDVITQCSHVNSLGEIETIQAEELDFAYRHSYYSDKNYIVTSATMNLIKANSDEIAKTMEDLMQRRKSKQPLNYPSAGSTFKRPVGYFAGGLIEECGLKGFSVNDAEVSEKHAGFVINKGNATCADILTLIEKVKEKVYTEKGVQLECEVKIIGEL